MTRHNVTHIGDADKYQIDTKQDIWDYNDLARKINDKDTNSLKEIADFLNNELQIVPDSILPKEVQTIVTLIDHLSNCDNPDADAGFIDEPDPKGKIYARFSDHSEFLTSTYVELYKIYGPNLESAKEVTDIGIVQVEKRSMYLKTHSDRVLTECDGDPQEALKRLTLEFANTIKQKNLEYDETAITFFLVDELTRCNIFPNSKKVNV